LPLNVRNAGGMLGRGRLASAAAATPDASMF
jgi:hypothetical protein